MRQGQPLKVRVYVRSVVAIALLTMWGLAALTGLLLWFAPHGFRAGREVLLLGLTKSQWGDVHFWSCVMALVITLVHVAVDWRALRGCVRYLTSIHRGPVSE